MSTEFRTKTYSLADHLFEFREENTKIEVFSIDANGQKVLQDTFYIGPDEKEVKMSMADQTTIQIEEMAQELEDDQYDLAFHILKFNEGGGILTIDIRDSMKIGQPPTTYHYPLDPQNLDVYLRLHIKESNLLVINSFGS